MAFEIVRLNVIRQYYNAKRLFKNDNVIDWFDKQL